MREPGITYAPGHPAELRDAAALRDRVRTLEEERRKLVDHVVRLEGIAQAGLMTAGLAHDLANQITGVMGAAELALLRGDEPALRDGLTAVLAHGARMHDTMEAFLAFVRRRESRVRVFSVPDLADAVLRLVQPVARAEGVSILRTVATSSQVRADRLLLEQAVVNLLLNAIRAASAGGGRVALSACDGPDDRVRISVRDTGTGIPPAIRERLFEPFVTGNAESGGHGLGLYVVRQVVEHYGGRVEVESTAAGTRIDLDLPSAAAGV